MDAAIQAESLTKLFGERRAVDDVSLELPQGAFLAIFGPNGAGKTTLLRLLATLIRPSSGTVRLLGVDSKEKPEQARGLLGLISHKSMLYPDLTAAENLLFAARLYGVPNPKQRVLELLEAVGLKHRRLDLVRGFSHGMTQRLSIARALIHDPRILLLDEPYSGLDPQAVAILDQLISQKRSDRTLVMVSHDLEKGLALCTHALLLAAGLIQAYGEKQGLDMAQLLQAYR